MGETLTKHETFYNVGMRGGGGIACEQQPLYCVMCTWVWAIIWQERLCYMSNYVRLSVSVSEVDRYGIIDTWRRGESELT